MSSAADRSVKRLRMAIKIALSDEYDTLPGKVDSATRLSYLLGLQKAVEIIEYEIKKEGDHVLAEQRRGDNSRKI
jgi:hypothetical protein